MVGGLLGIGGGIVLMPVLRFAVRLSPAYAAGTCILAVFFTTFGGGLKHYRLGHVPIRSLIAVIVSGALSTILFSLFFLYIAQKDSWLDFGIGLALLLVSGRMILSGFENRKGASERKTTPVELEKSWVKKITLGGLAGILPGLLGIGTGAVLVPGFVYLLKTSTKIAIGSSLACFAVNAFLSAVLKTAQGYVDFTVAIPICVGTLVGSQIGAIINNRTPSTTLRILFGLVFTGVSIRFLLSAFEAL